MASGSCFLNRYGTILQDVRDTFHPGQELGVIQFCFFVEMVKGEFKLFYECLSSTVTPLRT